MLFDFARAGSAIGDAFVNRGATPRWGVDSEYARLLDVMLSVPQHLELVPCNAVSIENHRNGLTCSRDAAGEQHRALVAALETEGVRCHLVPPAEGLADLSFTRDATLMTPWGLVALSPSVEHRLAEVRHIRSAAAGWNLPYLGAIGDGRVEGGDVCLLRPGIVAIGYSGERTDRAGAEALAGLFGKHGWRAILTPFDPRYLHLDTIFTVVDRNLALACVEALEPAFAAEMVSLGIDLLPVSQAEVQRLGGNILSLGGKRVLSPRDNCRVNEKLERLGHKVVAVEIDQFTRCGGGMHCLTMPLSRLPG